MNNLSPLQIFFSIIALIIAGSAAILATLATALLMRKLIIRLIRPSPMTDSVKTDTAHHDRIRLVRFCFTLMVGFAIYVCLILLLNGIQIAFTWMLVHIASPLGSRGAFGCVEDISRRTEARNDAAA